MKRITAQTEYVRSAAALLVAFAAATILSSCGPARETSLTRACSAGNINLVKSLLDQGADVNWKSPIGGDTPLAMAAMMDRTAVVQLLLDKGADVNLANSDGWTPLMQAALRGYEDMVRLLVDRGADVTRKNSNGATALDLAKGNEKVLSILKEKGGTPQAVNAAPKP